MTRVTKADLEALVRVLNNRLGRPVEWGKPGNLYVQEGYGNGPRLYEQLGLARGTREVSPRLPRGQMAQYIRAMLVGIDFAEVNLRTAAPHLDGLPGWGEEARLNEEVARVVEEMVDWARLNRAVAAWREELAAALNIQRDPYEVYGTPEHEAVLIEEERGR